MERDESVVLNIEGLREIIKDYYDDFVGKIFIGKRSGFFDDENESLQKLATDFKDLVLYGTVNEMIDKYCEQLKEQMK